MHLSSFRLIESSTPCAVYSWFISCSKPRGDWPPVKLPAAMLAGGPKNMVGRRVISNWRHRFIWKGSGFRISEKIRECGR